MEFSASEHLYRQVAEAIQKDIRLKRFTAKIPGERELAQRYKINFKTANKAVGMLVQQGLLARVKGKGTFIAGPEDRARARLNLIGLVVWHLDNPYFAKSVQTIERIAARDSISVMLHVHESDKSLSAFLKTLKDRGGQGLVYYGDPAPLMKREQDLAMVGLGSEPRAQCDYIHADVVEGGRLIGKHLGERAAGSVAYIGFGTEPTREARFEGFSAALKELGYSPRPNWIRGGDNNYRGGYHATMELLKPGKTRPRAIFCFNDYMAIGAERAIAELGLRVPGDIAVAGFDDSADESDLIVPTTSVNFSFEDTARAALRLLKRRLSKPSAPFEVITIKPRLIVRASTAG